MKNSRVVISLSNNGARPLLQTQRDNLAILSTFSGISTKTLEDVVKHFNLIHLLFWHPTKQLFQNVFSRLEMDVLEIVSGSLLLGIFPKSLKNAVVKPLLKKSNLDPAILNNYRPIPNLPFIGKNIAKAVLIKFNNFLAFWTDFNLTLDHITHTETAQIKC